MWRQCDGRSFAHKKLCRSLHLQVGLQQRHRGTHQRQTGTVTQYWNFKLDLRYFVMFVKFSFAVIHFWFIPKIMTSFLDQLCWKTPCFFKENRFIPNLEIKDWSRVWSQNDVSASYAFKQNVSERRMAPNCVVRGTEACVSGIRWLLDKIWSGNSLTMLN